MSTDTPFRNLADRANLRQIVADDLRAAIISGKMRPGELYSAPQLCKQFGVSATPVREAMLDLVKEQLVEAVPNKGYRVTEVSERTLDEISYVRTLLEIPAMRMVTGRIPSEGLARLRLLAQAIVDAAEAGDLISYTEADRVFHLECLGYTGNEVLVKLVNELRSNTRLFGLEKLAELRRLVDSAREHFDIVEALESGEVDRVDRVMRMHLSHVRGRWALRPPSEID